MKKIQINAKLYKSDHNGYCSDNECELELSIVNYIIDIPREYINYPEGDILEIDQDYWIKFLPEQKINSSGSYYCINSTSSICNGLGIHDYKYIINSVKIFKSND